MKKNYLRAAALSMVLAMTVTMIPGNISKAAYSYDDEYTLGFNNGIVAYKNGRQTSLSAANVKVYSRQNDRPFKSENNQRWDDEDIKLTQPVKYTTNDGKAHDVESMLTNFDFIADPTAIDNTEVDGKLYVYGTTEGFSYDNGNMAGNRYQNHSLTILSTEDMVNWTDEGFMDSANLTNQPSDSFNKVGGRFTSGQSWAPSGLKVDGDGDGDMEYYLFYTNGGAVGYVMGDSPTGPWKDPLGRALFTQGSPNCSGVVWCFDPGVICDKDGNCYVYFGGGTNNNKAHGKTGRVCKIKFAPGSGEVSMDGDPQIMDTYYFFEDSEINQFNDLYYYSYCANFDVPQSESSLLRSGSICVYVCSDPMRDIAFDPRGSNGLKYTDSRGVYHHYLGTVLNNPSTIYGESYNNHHHMQEYKDRFYIFYHSTVLGNTIFRTNKQYRNLHVDEIKIDADTDKIEIEPSYEGAEQIEDFDPYKDFNGDKKEINATTTSYSAGVKSTRSDQRVKAGDSPMVLDEIDTGDWTKIQGVNFGEKGAVKVEADIISSTDNGAIELFKDDPTDEDNFITKMSIEKTGTNKYESISAEIDPEKLNGKHDIYFVFRGSNYTVAAWKFTESDVVIATPSPSPSPTPKPTAKATEAPTPTPEPITEATVGNVNYKIKADGTAEAASTGNTAIKSVTILDVVNIDGIDYKVSSVASSLFSNNKKLTKVIIGKNVRKIYSKAFYNCKSLKKVIVKTKILSYVGKKAFKGTSRKLVIKVPKKKFKQYKKLFKKKGQKKSAKIK